MVVLRRISREDLDYINFGSGRAWVYVSKIAIPLSYQFLFPLFIIASNRRMRTSLARDFKELFWFRDQNT